MIKWQWPRYSFFFFVIQGHSIDDYVVITVLSTIEIIVSICLRGYFYLFAFVIISICFRDHVYICFRDHVITVRDLNYLLLVGPYTV